MSGSGSQATLQGPGSLPAVSLRDENLAGTGVRQVVQCFWKGSSVLGMQLSGRKLTKMLTGWTGLSVVFCGVSGRARVHSHGSLMLCILGYFTAILRTDRFQHHSVHRGELVQMTSDPNRGVGWT